MTPSRWKPSVVPSSSIANGTTVAAASVLVTPTWISYPPNVTPPAVVARTARVRFSRRQRRARGNQTQPRGRPHIRLDPRRIVDPAAEHLEPRHRCPSTRVPLRCCDRIQSARPAARSQLQIRNRVLAAGQHDDVVVAGGRRRNPVRPRQKPEVSRVRQVRQSDDRDARAWGRRRLRPGLQREAVLRVQVDVGGVREHTEAGRLRLAFQQTHAIVEERHVTTEPVDGEPAKQRPLLRREKVCRSDHRGEDAAALDIGHQDPGRSNPGHQTEVHEVVLTQIQLRDAACSFDDDCVEATGQILIRRETRSVATRRRARSTRGRSAFSRGGRSRSPGCARFRSA